MKLEDYKSAEEHGFKMRKNCTATTKTVVCVRTSVVDDNGARYVEEYWTTDGSYIGSLT